MEPNHLGDEPTQGHGANNIDAPRNSQPGRSKRLAVILAIFLGGLGIHKFYLNKPRLGILYVLRWWTYVPAIVGVVEGLRYLRMSDEAWAARYGSLPPRRRFGAGLLIGCCVACVMLVLVATLLADVYLAR